MKNSKPPYLTRTELNKMLKHYPENRDLNKRNAFGIFLMACFTGLTKIEILKLKFQDIKGDQLFILTRNVFIPITSKLQLLMGNGEPHKPIFVGGTTSWLNNDLFIIMSPLGIKRYIVLYHCRATYKNYLKTERKK